MNAHPAYHALAAATQQPRSAPRRAVPPSSGELSTAYKALFLDFDGVLHPTTIEVEPATFETVIGTGLFGWLPELERILRPHPDVAICVHSSWRYTHDIEELRELLGSLGGRVVGSTPRGPRYESIQWWLHLNPVFTSHCILDDDRREFPDPAPAELILCDHRTGVSAPTAQAALERWLRQ